MDRVVSVMSCANKVFGVHQIVSSESDVVDSNGIHVMNYDLTVNLIAIHSQVHSVVTHNHIVSYALPLSRSVELLIKISFEAERFFSNFAIELEILESLFKSVQENELRI